jgi:hypothetical protein
MWELDYQVLWTWYRFSAVIQMETRRRLTLASPTVTCLQRCTSASRDVPFRVCAMDISAPSLHNSRISMHDVTDRYTRSWKEPTLNICQKSLSRRLSARYSRPRSIRVPRAVITEKLRCGRKGGTGPWAHEAGLAKVVRRNRETASPHNTSATSDRRARPFVASLCAVFSSLSIQSALAVTASSMI